MKRFIGLLTVLILCCLSVSSFAACTRAGTNADREALDAVECRDLTWAVGGKLPDASDFLLSLPENGTAAFTEPLSFSRLDTYPITVRVTVGKYEKEFSVLLTLVEDREPPVIEGAKDLSVVIGEGVSYLSDVRVRDNCDGEVHLSVDSSAVILSIAGSYPVLYTARDAAGNVTTVTVTVSVHQTAVTEEMLYRELDRAISGLSITATTTTEQKIRKIYEFVYDHVTYKGTSEKGDWIRAAYTGLVDGEGDCYTYFALTKAFLTRLGIENMDIQRTEGIVTERHYWNYVNVGGSGTEARWYHLDCCHMIDRVKPWGCLMTDAQIAAYSNARSGEGGKTGYFYAYHAENYPDSCTQVITRYE